MKTEEIFNIVSDAYWGAFPSSPLSIVRKPIEEYTIAGVEFCKGVRYEVKTDRKSSFSITMVHKKDEPDFDFKFQSYTSNVEEIYQELLNL